MFLNNQKITEEIKREIKKFLETNDNVNTTQNLWDAAKPVLRGKFIAIESYVKKQEKHQIDDLTLHLKQLEKEQQQQNTPKLIVGDISTPLNPKDRTSNRKLIRKHKS